MMVVVVVGDAEHFARLSRDDDEPSKGVGFRSAGKIEREEARRRVIIKAAQSRN